MKSETSIQAGKSAYVDNLRQSLLGAGPQINGEESVPRDVSPDAIINLMIASLGEMKECTLVTQNQARQAFLLACAMSAVSCILFAAAVILAIHHHESDVPTYASGIAGAITTFLSATGLHIYSKSRNQMNRYYDSMHEDEKLLLAIHTANSMTGDKRDAALLQIVKKMIGFESAPTNCNQ